jgi:hypothetical protein
MPSSRWGMNSPRGCASGLTSRPSNAEEELRLCATFVWLGAAIALALLALLFAALALVLWWGEEGESRC